MQKPTVTVVIIDDNATRAELYAYWLDHVDVRVAVTKSQVLDAVDGDVTVAILAQEFGDGAGEKVLELVRARTRYCQVLTTASDRTDLYPSLDVDNHLVKPIFREDLRERVERLARQAVYSELLEEYYQATIALANEQKLDGEADPEREAMLEERVAQLKPMLVGLRSELDQEDLTAVMALASADDSEPVAESDGQTSKYMPNKCTSCGQQWQATRGTDPSKGAVRLGSHVWRCVDCGAVQMVSAAGNPRLTHSH